MQCDLDWLPPRWDQTASRKHQAKSKQAKRKWERSILRAETAERGEPAIYNPNLTDAQIEQMELSAVAGQNELPQVICHLRLFWVKLPNEIGASSGEKTNLIIVKYENNGSVHGHPVTEKYLKSKGAQL